MNQEKVKKGIIERSLIILSYIAYSLYVLIPIIPAYSTLIILFSLSVAGLILVFSILKNNVLDISSSVGKYKLSFWFVIFLMVMSTLIYRSIYSTYWNIGYYVIDIIAVVMLLCGDAFLSDKSDDIVENIVFKIGFISCIIGIVALAKSNFQVVTISDRAENTGNIQYYLWKLMEIWPCLIIMAILKRNDIRKKKIRISVTVILAVEYFILSVLFLKRVVFFDIAVLILIAFLANSSQRKQLFKMLVYFASILLGIYLISKYVFSFNIVPYISLTFSRFEHTSFIDFDRMKEFTALFDQYNWKFILTGMGFGSSHNGPGGVQLHIGLLNFIFKGGIVFFILILGVAFKSLRVVCDRAVPTEGKICGSIVLYTLLRSAVSPIWQPNPTRIVFAICIILMLSQYDKLYKKRGAVL